MIINLYSVPTLLGALLSGLIGLFVYFRNRHSTINIAFGIFCLAIVGWLFGYTITYSTKNPHLAIIFTKVACTSAAFCAPAFHFLTATYLRLKEEKKWVILSYTLTLFLAPFYIFTNYFMQAPYKYFWGYYSRAGILHPILLVVFYSIFLRGYFLLYKNYKRMASISTLESNRIKYIVIANIFPMLGSIDYLPKYGIEYYPFGFMFVIVFVFIIAYAILRYQLLDIEIVIKKTLVFAGLLASVFAILIIPTLIVQEYLLRSAGTAGKLSGLTISGIIIILTMRRIETFLVNVTDKYLFQKKYDYKELLKTFTSEVLTVLEIDKLLDLTRSKLKEIIKLDFCDLEIFDDNNRPNDFILSMAKSKGYVSRRDYPDIKAELIIPLTVNNDTIGLLSLGKKKSDEDYTQDDMDILLPLARTLTIAISNAQLVKELRKTQDEAAQKEKMATLGTLAAGMAHEIRNPITTIRIFSEYLPDKIKEAQFVDKYRDIVVKQVDKINHVVQTMIDFSADDASAEVESVSLGEKISELIELLGLSDSISNNIEFRKNIPQSLSLIQVNARELDEILLNLTQNASQAIKEKGRVSFEAFEKNESVILQIKDNGCGMSEEVQKHLFSPFFTTKSKGFGLGLFVVKELVDRNNGKIFVKSSIGNGTTFILEFQKSVKNAKV